MNNLKHLVDVELNAFKSGWRDIFLRKEVNYSQLAQTKWCAPPQYLQYLISPWCNPWSLKSHNSLKIFFKALGWHKGKSLGWCRLFLQLQELLWAPFPGVVSSPGVQPKQWLPQQSQEDSDPAILLWKNSEPNIRERVLVKVKQHKSLKYEFKLPS